MQTWNHLCYIRKWETENMEFLPMSNNAKNQEDKQTWKHILERNKQGANITTIIRENREPDRRKSEQEKRKWPTNKQNTETNIKHSATK